MKRSLILPALISATIAVSAGGATAGTVFDFIPRMSFVEQPELVSKDRAATSLVCGDSVQKKQVCIVDAKTVTPKTPQSVKN